MRFTAPAILALAVVLAPLALGQAPDWDARLESNPVAPGEEAIILVESKGADASGKGVIFHWGGTSQQKERALGALTLAEDGRARFNFTPPATKGSYWIIVEMQGEAQERLLNLHVGEEGDFFALGTPGEEPEALPGTGESAPPTPDPAPTAREDEAPPVRTPLPVILALFALAGASALARARRR